MERFELQSYFLQPSPELSPENVVQIQLKSLRTNDNTDDKGILGAFIFASPANKMNTGPVERFARMVRNPQYRAMLNHRQAKFEPVRISGSLAIQRVTLVTDDDEQITYIFRLSRQENGPYRGCWMTDAVMRE